jgi:hypothetical protein
VGEQVALIIILQYVRKGFPKCGTSTTNGTQKDFLGVRSKKKH